MLRRKDPPILPKKGSEKKFYVGTPKQTYITSGIDYLSPFEGEIEGSKLLELFYNVEENKRASHWLAQSSFQLI